MCDLLVYLDVLNTFVPEDHLFLHNMLHFIIPCNKLQGFFYFFLHFFGQLKEVAPEFHVGDTVKVYGKIKEGNRERVQVFEGTVLKRQGGGARETFTVRKFSNGIGVEKTWPVHSPNVEKIEVVRRGKVRRAKLNYLRDRVGKKAKVKELVK